jgi:hypothetical protein
LVLVIGAIVAFVVRSCNSASSGKQQSAASSQVSGTAQDLRTSAQAGSAVIRLTRDASAEAPAVDVPAVGPAIADPDTGGGLFEILEDVVEGL